MLLPFTKMQAVGNDFVVVEEAAWPEGTDWEREAIRLCDRKFGVGGDGLLLVCPSTVADIRMRMFNPDGTEDMCGNGLRCVVLWAQERGLLKGERILSSSRVEQSAKEFQVGETIVRVTSPFKKEIPVTFRQNGTVETIVGVRRVHASINVDGEEYIGDIVTDMGTPHFLPQDIPMIVEDRSFITDFPLNVEGYGKIAISSVNTGSTHTVIWVEELPDDELFFFLSPKIEHHPLFPERTSVLWAKLSQQPYQVKKIELRIWERGVGETLGCGTGACAVAVIAAMENKIDYDTMAKPVDDSDLDRKSYGITVKSKGGELHVMYEKSEVRLPDSGDPLVLVGRAHTVYTGTVPILADR